MREASVVRMWVVAAVLALVCAAGCGHEGDGAHAGHDEHAGHGRGAEGYSARFEFESAPQAGVPVTLKITPLGPDGEVVTEVMEAHERLSHLIHVSGDLVRFEHVHPERRADGSFTITLTFVEGGPFKLFADYVPAATGGVVLAEHRVEVAGAARPAQALEPGERVYEEGGTRVRFTPPATLKAGVAARVTFEVEDTLTGQPAADLEPYLGASGHLVIIGEGAERFVHTHPSEEAHGDHAGHGSGELSPKVVFDATFPTAGRYKLWAQVQRAGELTIAPFVVEVE